MAVGVSEQQLTLEGNTYPTPQRPLLPALQAGCDDVTELVQ